MGKTMGALKTLENNEDNGIESRTMVNNSSQLKEQWGNVGRFGVNTVATEQWWTMVFLG
jgi:hypothetical protein